MPVFTTLALSGLLGAGGAAASIIGGVEQNKQAKKAAAMRLRQGQLESEDERRRASQAASRNRALAGASGLGGASASLATIRGLFDSLESRERILTGAALEAKDIKKQGKAALIGGIGQGASSLFSTGLSVFGLGKDLGVFGK